MFEHAAGKTIPALDTLTANVVFTCSTGNYASGAAINGKVVDRLGLVAAVPSAALGVRDRCLVAEPFIYAIQHAGSTSAARNVSLDIKLQHGDSSGGGDMADYSTGAQPATANFYHSGLTTDMKNWTTGLVAGYSNPCHYELTGAKRYIRAVGAVTKFGVSTSTVAPSEDAVGVAMGINFREFTYSNPSPVSTSSSTST